MNDIIRRSFSLISAVCRSLRSIIDILLTFFPKVPGQKVLYYRARFLRFASSIFMRSKLALRNEILFCLGIKENMPEM